MSFLFQAAVPSGSKSSNDLVDLLFDGASQPASTGRFGVCSSSEEKFVAGIKLK